MVKTIETVCVRKMQPVIDHIRDMLISHEVALNESYLTLSKLAAKYKEQLNLFDRNKIGYNFVFMFASPSYLELKNKSTTKKIPYARL